MLGSLLIASFIIITTVGFFYIGNIISL